MNLVPFISQVIKRVVNILEVLCRALKVHETKLSSQLCSNLKQNFTFLCFVLYQYIFTFGETILRSSKSVLFATKTPVNFELLFSLLDVAACVTCSTH